MADPSLANLPYDSITLEITEGPGKGRRCALQAGENVLGRSIDAQVQLEDHQVSREHACITVEGEDIKIQDMGSAQGTVLNGRLLMGADFLFDNDQIRIGPYTLRISVQRRESRAGLVIATLCLIVAMVFAAIALAFPQELAMAVGQSAAANEVERIDPVADWRNWENLVLPSAEILAEEGFATNGLEPEVVAQLAEHQFDLGSRLYQDRLGDLGNAYRALVHYKRALGLAEQIDNPEARPAISNRCLERIVELRSLILSDVEKRVFAYQQKLKVAWYGDARRVLFEIMSITPWAGSRHNRWAAQKLEELDRLLQG